MESEEQDITTAKRFNQNDDWKWAKAKLSDMMEIYKITLDYKLADTALGKEMKRRKDVMSIITSWIEYIEGTADVPINTAEQNNLVTRF